MKKYCFLLVVAFYGCAPVKFQLPYEVGEPYNFQLVDQRDDQQKTRKVGSISVTACDYAVKRYADDETTPDRISYLRYALAKADVAPIKGKIITVKRFTLYDNAQGLLRKDAINAGAVAGAMAGASVTGSGTATASIITQPSSSYGCAPALSEGGFTAAENPTFQPVAVSEIMVSVEGKNYFSRAVEEKNNDGPTIVKRVLVDAVNRLIIQLK